MSKTAHILAITSASVLELTNDVTGFIPVNIFSSVPSEEVFVASRPFLEKDRYYQQIIPYVIITQEDKFLAYTRKTSGGESRLHRKVSIGFGGHIDFEDIVSNNDNVILLQESIEVAASREILEELGLDEDIPSRNIIGTINDRSNDVGKVHVGAVVKLESDWELDNYTIEDQIELLGYKTLDELKEYGDDLENWTKLVVDSYSNGVLK